MKRSKPAKKKRWICYHCRKLNEAGKRKCIYCKENKVGSRQKLEKKLDAIFSKFIRKRDNYKCVTCGAAGDQAGHYKKRSHKNTRWCEKNVNCQCARCNLYLGGNESKHAIYLEKKYGFGILQELDEKAGVSFQPQKWWLLEQIEKYEQKVNV